MKKETKYRILKIIGYIVVIAGIIGLFLPFLQGLLLLAVGLYLISLGSPSMREKLKIHFKRNIKFSEIVDKIDRAIERLIEKL